MPEGVEIRKTLYGNGLFATKEFKSGTVVYIHAWYDLDEPISTEKNPTFTLKCNRREGEKALVDMYTIEVYTHTILQYNNKRQFYYFDSFMNHNCDPSTKSEEIKFTSEGGIFECKATRDIHVGDQLTCDYGKDKY